MESGSTDILICAEEPLPPWMKVRPSAVLLGVELPPVLLIHSEFDPIVSVENSRVLYDKLVKTGHRADYYELEGCDAHGGMVFYGKEVLEIVQRFCMTCINEKNKK